MELSQAAGSAIATAVTTLVDQGSTYASGRLVLRASGADVLTVPFANPAFQAPDAQGVAYINTAANVVVASEITPDAFEVRDADDSLLWSGVVSGPGGAGDLVLTTATVPVGGLKLEQFSYSVGQVKFLRGALVAAPAAVAGLGSVIVPHIVTGQGALVAGPARITNGQGGAEAIKTQLVPSITSLTYWPDVPKPPVKHTRWTQDRDTGRFYWHGGDYAGYGVSQDGKQGIIEYNLETDTWTPIIGICAGEGEIQPGMPDVSSLFFDPKRSVLWYLPGIQYGHDPGACLGTLDKAMYFTPATGKWAIAEGQNSFLEACDGTKSFSDGLPCAYVYDYLTDAAYSLGYNGHVSKFDLTTHQYTYVAVNPFPEVTTMNKNQAARRGREIWSLDNVSQKLWAYHIDKGTVRVVAAGLPFSVHGDCTFVHYLYGLDAFFMHVCHTGDRQSGAGSTSYLYWVRTGLFQDLNLTHGSLPVAARVFALDFVGQRVLIGEQQRAANWWGPFHSPYLLDFPIQVTNVNPAAVPKVVLFSEDVRDRGATAQAWSTSYWVPELGGVLYGLGHDGTTTDNSLRLWKPEIEEATLPPDGVTSSQAAREAAWSLLQPDYGLQWVKNTEQGGTGHWSDPQYEGLSITSRDNQASLYCPKRGEFWVWAGTIHDGHGGGVFNVISQTWTQIAPRSNWQNEILLGIIERTGWDQMRGEITRWFNMLNGWNEVCDTGILAAGQNAGGSEGPVAHILLFEPNPAGPEPYRTTWLPNSMPYASYRARNQSAMEGENFWFYGGRDITGVYRTELWRFHIPTRTWKRFADGPFSRDYGCMTYDSKRHQFLLHGGDRTNSTAVYDILTDTWMDYTVSADIPFRTKIHNMSYSPVADMHCVRGGTFTQENGVDWPYWYSDTAYGLRLPPVSRS